MDNKSHRNNLRNEIFKDQYIDFLDYLLKRFGKQFKYRTIDDIHDVLIDGGFKFTGEITKETVATTFMLLSKGRGKISTHQSELAAKSRKSPREAETCTSDNIYVSARKKPKKRRYFNSWGLQEH